MESLAVQQQGPQFPMVGNAYQPLPRGKEHGRVMSHAVQTIMATPEQVFNIFNRPELLPTWQEGVVSVTALSDRKHHSIMQDPGTGKQIEFDAEALELVPNKDYWDRDRIPKHCREHGRQAVYTQP